ncbi:DUF4339 domain-containing protein [Bythopirellula polymerisocia]|uniref:GYF domain-containing protein n=1 Tax=Bythopirellula polymerisocia TaxID=2528003 RepID=A0A5C6CXA7_9BACT|nr:DUF4339 domain-containing protein [Bythopirellula polymerisocia]TWU28244.1 hypothetical protein Pla144_15310 [Bythopirellula polymerisocia]
MGIRFLCPNGHKLNVKEHLAGKRGICPDCDARFLVPSKSGGQVEGIIEAPPRQGFPPSSNSGMGIPTDSGVTIASDVWHIRTAGGEQLGPANTSLVKAWIGEKRIDQDSWVWRSDWLDWQRASDVFPELGAPTGPGITAGTAQPQQSPILADEIVPQESEIVTTHRRLQRARRQRARAIAIALTGLICLMAVILAIILLK